MKSYSDGKESDRPRDFFLFKSQIISKLMAGLKQEIMTSNINFFLIKLNISNTSCLDNCQRCTSVNKYEGKYHLHLDALI